MAASAELSWMIMALVSISSTDQSLNEGNKTTDIYENWPHRNNEGVTTEPNESRSRWMMTKEDKNICDEALLNKDHFSVYKTVKTIASSTGFHIQLSVNCTMKGLLSEVFGECSYFLEEMVWTKKSSSDVCCFLFRRKPSNSTLYLPSVGGNLKLLSWASDFTWQKPIADVLKLLAWSKTCVLYTETFLTWTNGLTTELSERGVRFWLHSVESSSNTLVQKMSACYYTMMATGINFILVANQSMTEMVFARVNSLSKRQGPLSQLGLMSRWFIVGDDFCIRCLEPQVQNVSNVSILRKVNQNIQVSREDLVSRKRIVAEVITAYWQRTGRQFGTVVTWSSTGEMTAYNDVFPNVRMGLNNVTLTVTTKEWPPFTIKTKVDGKLQFKGVCLDLIEEMSRRLNFSYVVVEPPDGQWGMKMLSGKWTGMIAQLANREVDVMVAAASIQQEREEVMDFVHPFYNDYTSLLLKKPDKTLQKWKILISVLEWPVVLCLAIALPLVTLCLTTVEKFHPYYESINRKNKRGLHRFDDCLWYNLAALLNEGGQETPRDQAGRTLVAAWWLFTIVIVASYTSTLTASLTVERVEIPFNTIEEMVEQTEYKWGGTNGSYMFMLFEKSDNAIYQKLWAGIQRFLKEEPNILTKHYPAQMDRVRQGNYVLMSDKSVSLIEAAHDCDLALAKQEFLPLNFGIGLQQNSPYRHLFQHHMIAIEESGILEMWKTKWWPPMHNCTNKGPAQVKAISLSDVQGGYIILGIGMVVSVITFLVEHTFSRIVLNCKCPICAA